MENQTEAKPVKTRVPFYQVKLERNGSIVEDGKIADCPFRAEAIFREMVADSPKEHFMLMCLNVRNKVIGVCEISVGTLSASLVHPRELFGPAILLNAAAIIVGHNHPSGDCTPSAEDKDVTRRLQESGTLLGIPLLDHVIINGTGDFYSFREQGLLKGERR
ncbi:MAG: JAB domain-containing protein [Elusimicrobiota bacterium]